MDIILDRHLNNKVVLITGAAQRLGARMAQFFHAAGANVIIHYRASDSKARQLQQQLNEYRPNSVQIIQCDLLQTEQLEKFIAQCVNFWGRLDVLINNASSFFPTPVLDSNEQQWQDLMGSNLKAPYFLSKHAASQLAKQQGCIIDIVDIHAQRPMQGHSIYNMAKAGLAMQVKTLARELGPDIRVNGIAPGAILWPESGQTLNAEQKQQIIKHNYLKRLGSPDDIARTALFLVKDADYISGQIIPVDGGRIDYI